MTRDVKSIPEVASFEASTLCLIRFHVASTVSVLDHVEDTRPAEPEECGNYEPRNMVLQELLEVSAAKRKVCEIQERGREQQSPEPAQLDEVNVEKIVRSCEVRLGEGYKV